MQSYKKSELKNGVRVVSEFHPQSRAVAISIWVNKGSRDEPEGYEGLAHFLEHLVFKRTKTRTAYQIAKALEALGGELNAFTTKDNTCYHALVLKDHWKKALEILSDLVSNMEIGKEDFKIEKGVILQEIAMGEDSHEDLVYDYFFQDVYGKHQLGTPILGTVKSITDMKLKEINHFYKTLYTGKNLIVSAAGNIDHQDLTTEVDKLLGFKKRYSKRDVVKRPSWKRVRKIYEKSTEQTHVVMGLPSSSYKDPNRFESYIVNTLLGGGMTSRLYQSVRERRGLVYSVHSTLNAHVDTGSMLIYAGVDSQNIKKVGELIVSELIKLKKYGVKESEVDLFKTQVIGSILLGSDDVENRMNSIAVNEMVFGKYKPIDNIIKEIQSVDAKSVNHYIKTKIDLDKLSGVILGSDIQKLQSWWEEL